MWILFFRDMTMFIHVQLHIRHKGPKPFRHPDGLVERNGLVPMLFVPEIQHQRQNKVRLLSSATSVLRNGRKLQPVISSVITENSQ